jgi:hypothetical protein
MEGTILYIKPENYKACLSDSAGNAALSAVQAWLGITPKMREEKRGREAERWIY